MPPLLRVSYYNTALCYKKVIRKATQAPSTPRHRCCVSTAVNETTARIRTLAYAEYGGMEGRTEYQLFIHERRHAHFSLSRETEISLRE